MSIFEFITKNIEKRINIYGAGNLGNLLYWYIKNCNKQVDAYVVSNYVEDGYYVTNGLPIHGKDAFIKQAKNKSDIAIIVAIKFMDVIGEELKRAGFNNVYCLDANDELMIAHALFDQMDPGLKGKCGKDNKQVNIRNQMMLNPFESDERFLDFFMGGVDMLFPWLYGKWEYINEGPYEYDRVVMREGDTVINCGASIGLFTQIGINRKCKMYCFEPAKKQLRELRKVVSFYPNADVTICKKALSDKVGLRRFYIHKSFEYDGFYRKKDCLEECKVETITIDEYVKRNRINKIDFIKSNIEGAEREMLLGATDTLKKYAPKLSIRANHLPDDVEVVTSIIKNANSKYHVIHKYKNIYAYVD